MRCLSLSAALAVLPLAALAAALQTVTLSVQNMNCSLCPITIKKALEKVNGMAGVTFDFEAKTATVTFDPDKANAAAIAKAVTEAGYPASVK